MATNKWIAGLGTFAMLATIACNADRGPVVPGSATAVAPNASIAAKAPQPAGAAAGHGRALAAIGEATAILRDVPLAQDVTVSRQIGPDGGRLEIPEAGLRLEVPRGAVREATTFTVTALAGDMVAYEFGPDGSRFQIPLLVVQDTKGTNLDRLPRLAVVQAGYFTGPDMLDHRSKKARLAEVLPTYGLKVDDEVGFLVWHFSGYLIHWGYKPRAASSY